MQFGEAKHVRVVDDHRVGGWDIDAALDDGGRDKDVRVAPHKAKHGVLEFLGRHLPVPDGDARTRGEPLQIVGNSAQVADAIVHEEHLPLTGKLAQNRLLNSSFVERDHLGHDGAAVGGRGGEGADVAQTEHRHVQRARNRRGRKREHIGRHSKLKQTRLVLDAEALLLVDDDQTEVLERDILREHAMGADDDIDAPLGQRLKGRALLGVGLETAHALNAKRISAKAVAKAALVLLAQHRRRHQHRDLHSRVDRFERGADGDLGFAKTDIAANEPIHRSRTLHVALGCGDGGELIVGFVVRKLRFKLALPVSVNGERRALGRAARRLNPQQFTGKVAG